MNSGHPLSRLLILAILSLSYCKQAPCGPLYPGLQTFIWFDMWQDAAYADNGIDPESRRRRAVTAMNLEKYRELGAKWNLVHVFQERDSKAELMRLHRVVEKHRQNGIDVIFRLLEDPEIYSELTDIESTSYGYHKDYFDWVSRLAREFRSEVNTYIISNEIDNDLRFNTIDRRKPPHKYLVGYEDYRKVLDTAYRAIKGGDPTLTVVSHGFSSTSLGLAVADAMIREGEPQKAYEFWKTFQTNRGLYAESFPHFIKQFINPATRRKIDIVRKSLTKPGNCDAFQLHYYHSWAALPQVLAWMKNTMQIAGTTRPILATEVGYVMPWKIVHEQDGKTNKIADIKDFSEQDQAVSLVKLFAILSSNRIDMIEYWQMRFHHDRSIVTRLYHAPDRPDHFKPLRAAFAYRILTHELDGLVATKPKLAIPGVSEFRYVGDRVISIVWSEQGNHLPADILDQIDGIFDIYGSPVTPVKGEALPLSHNPIYIHWKRLGRPAP